MVHLCGEVTGTLFLGKFRNKTFCFVMFLLSECIVTAVHRTMQAQANDRKALEATLCEESQRSKKRHEKILRQSEARSVMLQQIELHLSDNQTLQSV